MLHAQPPQKNSNITEQSPEKGGVGGTNSLDRLYNDVKGARSSIEDEKKKGKEEDCEKMRV